MNIIFFVKPGLDSFINPVIDKLSETYPTKKVIVRDMKQIDSGMKWADVCWFEWCDDLAIYGSKLPLACQKTVVCRLHSYEAFTNNLTRVYWETVDRLIFVGKSIKDYVLDQMPKLREKAIVIENGVDIDKFPFRNREKGFQIAYVGYINYKKGPMLLLQSFKALHDHDSRYTLHIAGSYQDRRYSLYFKQMLEELNLKNNVKFYGWQRDVNHFLDDKDYIISTSLFETQNMAIMEGMAKGLKPLVHNFYGAKEIYDASFVWSSIKELTEMVTSGPYSSQAYRSFIEENYTLAHQMDKTTIMIQSLKLLEPSSIGLSDTSVAKITVGIINYNYSQYLDQCLESILAQTYPNLEIIIVDDNSTDGSQDKIRSYQEKYGNITSIYHEQNLKLPDIAIQEIFQNAKGDYVLPISADDFLVHNQVLEDYLHCFDEQKDLDYVYGDLLLVDKTGQIFNQWVYKSYSDNEVVKNIFQRFGSGVIPMVGLFKLAFYRDNDYSWVAETAKPTAGDTLNCLINTKRGWKRRHLNKPSLCHRKHDNNLSYSSSYDVDKRIKSMIYLLDYIVQEFSEEVYLPHIKWHQYDVKERLALKHYTVGQCYWKMANNYFTNTFTKHLDRDAKTRCVKPILDKVGENFRQSLAIGEAYKEKINCIEKEILSFVQL